ncbi:carbamoyltransferase family protein [Cellvibrio japonicus]|uniref:Nodulation protein n=1 Tax=Cellvibrio japonicus (strain Ueda107) TaxID=498211 RepID=B3PKX4_CELJU|nr:carbamoyltransferase [Cellvibrio japonicus]ACE84303.1 nodulation protein [Cellvibrio japonicus Ueda107]QEI12877.1 carbamoyltransferase [Cellvibrio japonicus]QEI16451.1 carbamoyltransferase [Cellvibrio japonicus]QEI20029.1 carbamoyltransferase [Cellvibrio japonicus]
MTRILGISAYYHDSAAALVIDGKIIAAAQEERFTRIKHDPAFPTQAVRYCLDEAGCTLDQLDAVVFYDKPLLKFERLLETYLAHAPRGFGSFLRAMPIWLKEKLFLKTLLRRELRALLPSHTLPPDTAPAAPLPRLLFTEHHQAHAASAFFPSPFASAAVLCLDGVGEWATSSAWSGHGNDLQPLWEIHFPHSLGLLYSAFTYYCGFRVNSGEYKLMGLAPYGEPRYVEQIYQHLIDVKPDGSFRLNLDYFAYPTGERMTNDKFHALFGGPPRSPDTLPTQKDMDLARSIQQVTEDIVLKLATSLHRETGMENLCLAGGVALNCVANGELLRKGPFKQIWIQPAAGDAGGALGAALQAWHQYYDQPRTPVAGDTMQGAYLGPAFDDVHIRQLLEERNAPYQHLDDEQLYTHVARHLAEDKVVGWFQGRMEFGPRALGNRSILGNPASAAMQSTMNLKIKYRESFRPFAPAVLEEEAARYFELNSTSPYMLRVAPLANDWRLPDSGEPLFGLDKLKQSRSQLPAITHVDYSARVQTVSAETNPRFTRLLHAFKALTGWGLLINTSFNVRGEPPVSTPAQAYDCFLRTEMDYLVMGNYLLDRHQQSPQAIHQARQQAFAPD